MDATDLRRLPSVDRLVQYLEATEVLPRQVLVEAARAVIDAARGRLLRGEPAEVDLDLLGAEAGRVARLRATLSLTRAINATGVILHTNLGRAPLSARAATAVVDVLSGYSTLEIDRDTGRRGARDQHVEPLLTRLVGAEAAVAVNNNAGAVLLALSALARGKDVVVSRGELVEIGGSFRLPEVMAQSGARLVEVGTTNRTYPRDYERVLTIQTGLLLKVHRSNFVQRGFVHDASAAELVEIGRREGIPVMFDLGSGCLVDLRMRGLPYEPTVQEAVALGCDLVTFSGDKLLGGPQAGLLVGRAAVVEMVRSHPLARALRMDKLDSAALAATLYDYLDPQAVWEEVPVLRMLARPAADLEAAAGRLRDAVAAVAPASWQLTVKPTTAEVGGGSVPDAQLPSYAVAIHTTGSLDKIELSLRRHQPPIFARIAEDALLIDVRTLLPGDEDGIVSALATHMSSRA